jgi:bacteriocin-like protein
MKELKKDELKQVSGGVTMSTSSHNKKTDKCECGRVKSCDCTKSSPHRSCPNNASEKNQDQQS